MHKLSSHCPLLSENMRVLSSFLFWFCGDDDALELNVLGCRIDILETNYDQCVSMVQCCFTSTETVRLIRTESPGRPPRLSRSSWSLKASVLFLSTSSLSWCIASTETVWFTRDNEGWWWWWWWGLVGTENTDPPPCSYRFWALTVSAYLATLIIKATVVNPWIGSACSMRGPDRGFAKGGKKSL